MKYLLALVALLVVLLSCSSVPPGTIKTCDDGPRRVRVRFAPDPAFTLAERAQLQRAVDEWFAFSDGRVDFSLAPYALELDDSSPHIYRTESWMRVVRAKERELKTQLAGWATNDPHVFLVIDWVAPDQLWILAAHELGHVAGLQWPNCDGTRKECIHSPDPRALMAPAFSGQPFGASDLDLCRASCVCS